MNFSREEIIKRADIIVEALPYISRYSGKTVVIKYGGNAMNNPDVLRTILQDVATLKIVGVNPVLVHGGGPEINAMLQRLGIKSEFINGMRVTDKDAMDVVQMVLCGKINKRITAALNTMGVKAAGLSGGDGGLIEVEKLPVKDGVDYGYVGKIVKINTRVLESLLSEFIPVIATVGVDKDGAVYNVNADVAAGAIGGALEAERLMFLTDVDGIRADEKDPASLIPQISVGEIQKMIKSGAVTGGMLPKVASCIDALNEGIKNVLIINGAIPHSILLELFTDSGIGTLVTK
ncbi:MAG: acetylglutamate kinase [Clostridiales bacterium]|jgi:acetylglutamate kinase|nr:acetylglutamate kinase [Clostridiales bacterium]